MKNSARRHEPPGAVTGLLSEAAAAAGYAISRNPVLVGGGTAFLVVLFYVSANALWYQPYFHSGAFVATRTIFAPMPADEQKRADPVPVRSVPVTKIAVPTPEPAPAADNMRTDAIKTATGDEKIRHIQTVLAELKLYDGEIDGLSGPRTRAAIQHYQRIIGLEPTGEVDQAILDRLKPAGQRPASAVPSPRPGEARMAALETPAASPDAADPVIARLQAGLRAFGNEGIQIDGRMGNRTRTALKEFQTLFGLSATGEPNEEVVAKMREIGLIE